MNARPQTPELAKRLQEIQESNCLDREWMADERLEEIIRLCGIIDNHNVCASRAAWRRDRALLGYHLQCVRTELISALQTYKMLPSLPSEGGNE